MPSVSTHGIRCENCTPWPASNRMKTRIANAIEANVVASATARMASRERPGMSATKIAPSNGNPRMRVSNDILRDRNEQKNQRRPDHKEKRIGLQISRLQQP